MNNTYSIGSQIGLALAPLLVTTLESVHRIRVVAALAIDAHVEAYARAEIERVTQHLCKATEALK